MKRSEVIKIAANITAGILSNPACGITLTDSWSRQQLIQQVIQDTINAFYTNGIPITEEEP